MVDRRDSSQPRIPASLIVRMQRVEELAELLAGHRQMKNGRPVQILQEHNLVHYLIQESDDEFAHLFCDDARLPRHARTERV